MKQFILGAEPDKDSVVRLEGKDYRYLVRVRRLAVGKFFPALLPNGEETLIQVISIDSGVLTGKCTLSAPSHLCGDSCETIPPIILFQALPKGCKMDLIVRQAAEGGISEIVPFLSEFSVAKANTDGQKFARWEKIIKEARQQSGSKTATVLSRSASRGYFTKNELFDYWKELKAAGALGVLFHHCQSKGVENKSLHRYLNSNPKAVVLAIGPEGGFSEKEVSFFLESGLLPLTIGDSVLRTETAALYCAAAIRILLLERNSWELKQTKAGKG